MGSCIGINHWLQDICDRIGKLILVVLSTLAAFHATKILVKNFRNSTCTYNGVVAQTRPKPLQVWLLILYAGGKRAVLGAAILSNGKGHFRPTDRPR